MTPSLPPSLSLYVCVCMYVYTFSDYISFIINLLFWIYFRFSSKGFRNKNIYTLCKTIRPQRPTLLSVHLLELAYTTTVMCSTLFVQYTHTYTRAVSQALGALSSGSNCHVRIKFAAQLALHAAFFTMPWIIGPATTTSLSPFADADRIMVAAADGVIRPWIRASVFSGAESAAIFVLRGPGKAQSTFVLLPANRRIDLEYETSPSFDAP